MTGLKTFSQEHGEHKCIQIYISTLLLNMGTRFKEVEFPHVFLCIHTVSMGHELVWSLEGNSKVWFLWYHPIRALKTCHMHLTFCTYALSATNQKQLDVILRYKPYSFSGLNLGFLFFIFCFISNMLL